MYKSFERLACTASEVIWEDFSLSSLGKKGSLSKSMFALNMSYVVLKQVKNLGHG